MTNETKQRIRYYESTIPLMKEKIVAAAMMLVIALTVAVTATYAWVTLSTAPEVSGVDTSVIANGSLEIALANGTGNAPGKSTEGDSTGAGNPITAANITWGNLVNLSDSSYGLTKVTLRPAALNGSTGLLTNPLYGVGYGEDGRVSAMVTDDDFAYTYFDTTSSKFLVDLQSNHLGVRAISTVKYENLEGAEQANGLLGLINSNLFLAKSGYSAMTNRNQEPGSRYIASLEGLIQVYAQNVIDQKPTNQLVVDADYITALYDMMDYFMNDIMYYVGESYVNMANLLDLTHESGTAKGDAGFDVESLVTASRANSIATYISSNLSGLKSYANDYYQLRIYLTGDENNDYSDWNATQKKNSLAYWAWLVTPVSEGGGGGTAYWSDIESIINWICKINTATLDGYTMSGLANMSTASKILFGSNPHSAVLNDGAIVRMEKRIGVNMEPTISVTVDASDLVSLAKDPITLNAILTTSATDPWEMETDRDKVKSFNTGNFRGDTASAEDTYALAIDLWVRTNAGSGDTTPVETTTETIDPDTGAAIKTTSISTPEQAYLTLEGHIVTGLQETAATYKDSSGNEYPLYTATVEMDANGETQTETLTVFERYNTYYAIDGSTNQEYDLEAKLNEEVSAGNITSYDVEYTPQVTQEEVVIGYEGVNRVWTENQMSEFIGTGTSTTQGSGSCYVFYANTPADQSRFLELLGSMKVVFINGQGRKIGAAYMDTENYYALNGKVTVPLVLDTSDATKLGTDLNGNTIYGLTTLTKNAATRITALVYLDGTSLTNEMVLASGDIQGNLNIQFGCSTASKTTTTVETTTEVTDENGDPMLDEDGNVVTETVTDNSESYTSGTDSEAIRNEPVMSEFIQVSALVDGKSEVEFEYNATTPTQTELAVTVKGLTPSNVSVRFIRAISSTQGVQQDMQSLTEDGESWSKTCTFVNPGTYILRSVWVDGVEYSLDTPVMITVIGSSVDSLTCDALPSGSRSTTVMTADSSYSTGMTLGFTTSAQVPNRVEGIFMDQEGRQVNVPFQLINSVWTGTATFTTSGTYTMKYVEIDGEIYELSDSLQPTLEILLGLKVRTWITASDETLAKLQQINPEAVPTSFVLDPSVLDVANKKDVTLQVAMEIYDNSGNEITGLSDVELYYARQGSSIRSMGLDGVLSWNSTADRYTGSFLVTLAGTYKYGDVTINVAGKENIITSYTSAPSITAMPPEDAYYFDNHTVESQYSPNMKAEMVLGLAYSNAATKIEATITNGSEVMTVEGTLGAEDTEHQGDDSVNLWKFLIPTVNGTQEGEWTLTDITMYGVYYDDVYYAADGNGVKVDLTGENIHAKVTNYLYVTLSGSSQKFISTDENPVYFMDSNNVTDMTVTIADYEGNAIEDVTIGDVKVVYYLDSTKVSLTTYGYTADNLSSVNVSGEGALVNGSSTQYNISAMNFQYAGPYDTATVSFTLNGTSVTAGGTDTGTILRYVDQTVDANGKNVQVAQLPTYEVKWAAPDVTITKVDPAYSQTDTFTITSTGDSDISNDKNSASIQTGVTNWVSNDGHAAVIRIEYEPEWGLLTGAFTAPKVTLKLNDAGQNFSSTVFSVPKGTDADTARDYSFTTNGQSVTQNIGEATNLGLAVSHNDCGLQTIKIVTMTAKSGASFTVNLATPVVINQQGIAPELTLSGLDGYTNVPTIPSVVKVSSPEAVLDQKGNNKIEYVVPELKWEANVGTTLDPVISNDKTSTFKVAYYSHSTGGGLLDGFNHTNNFVAYDRTQRTWTETGTVETYHYTYEVDYWVVNGKKYYPGDSIPVTGKMTATAHVVEYQGDLISSVDEVRNGTTIHDQNKTTVTTTTRWNSSTTPPSGYTSVKESDIRTTATTTYVTVQ